MNTAAPVVLAIVVLLLSGGITAIVVLLIFKRRKATDRLQFTLTSPTNNGPTNIEEKKVKLDSLYMHIINWARANGRKLWSAMHPCVGLEI